jgi:hypothetical protein
VHHVVLLVITLFILTSTAAAFGPRDQELMLLDGIDPLNPFPAGLSPVPTIPFLYKYQEPAVPSNAYRGVYVSSQPSPCRLSWPQEQMLLPAAMSCSRGTLACMQAHATLLNGLGLACLQRDTRCRHTQAPAFIKTHDST